MTPGPESSALWKVQLLWLEIRPGGQYSLSVWEMTDVHLLEQNSTNALSIDPGARRALVSRNDECRKSRCGMAATHPFL